MRQILLCLFMVLSVLSAGKPELNLSTSMVYPRLGMFEQDESLQWRTLLGYQQSFGKLSITTLSEYGSENYSVRNPFRLHTFYLGVNIGKHALKLGRIPYWNALYQGRIDGISLTFSMDRFGRLDLIGGLSSSIDFSDTSIVMIQDGEINTKTDDIMPYVNLYGSWSKYSSKYRAAFYSWIEGLDENAHLFFGTGISTSMFGVGLKTTLSMDLTDSQLSYARIRASYKVGSHRLAFNYRQKRIASYRSWAWMTEPVQIAPTISMDVYSPISNKIVIWNQIGLRLASESTQYLKSTIQYSSIHLSLITGTVGESFLVGAVAGTQGKAGPYSFGGSLSMNALDYGEMTELKNAAGFYGWIGWKPHPLISLRLFGRAAVNPWYKIDGRGGVSIHAAL